MIRDINNIDDDIIRKKRIIAEMLYSDPDIIEVLDNKELDPNCPDTYLYENIYPFIRIPGTQDVSKSFITFMLDDMETAQINKSMKSQFLKVVIFVHKDLIKTKYGAERHDLLGLTKWPLYVVIHIANPLNCSNTLRVLLPQHNWKQ